MGSRGRKKGYDRVKRKPDCFAVGIALDSRVSFPGTPRLSLPPIQMHYRSYLTWPCLSEKFNI